MTTTNRLISLFAAMLFATTMLADVVYEPLEVTEGFNRDVIAETYYTENNRAYPSNCISYLQDAGTYYSMATGSVTAAVDSSLNYNQTDLINARASGWPDDNGNPDDRIIRVIAEASEVPLYSDVTWKLAPYNQPNVLTMRPDNTIGGTGSLKFKKVGCYNKVFFLLASAFEGSRPTTRNAYATIYYTDGTSSEEKVFEFSGLSGQDKNKKNGHRVRMINIYEGSSGYKKNTTHDSGEAYVAVFDMDVDYTKLIDRIEFENKIDDTSVMIFGVTGRTAAIEAPDDASTEVNDIEKTSFQACWDAIEDAASYRIDVAEDIDFQRILEDYNNLPVSGSTCQDIVNLVSNTDYYWRVRSVDADGGQSASSAVRRVKTAPDAEKGDTPPYAKEGNRDVEDMLAPYVNAKASLAELDIYRSLYRDGAFNTLCLPFDLDAAQIAASPLVGVQVYEYVSANTEGGQLNIVISEDPIDHITAGVPYLVKWDMNETEPIDKGKLVFKNVNVVTNQGQTLGGENEVKFVGNIGIATMVDTTLLGLDHNKLFLGAENKLYWPEATTSLKGFRAYFLVPDSPSGAPKRTPARIVQRENNATGIESVHHSAISIQKILRNGQICILRDGQTYNLLGGKMAPKP